MKKQILRIGAVASAAAAMALFGSATAEAEDDYAGQTYEEASEAAEEEDLKVVVGVRFGDKLEEDECIVTSSQTVSQLRHAPFFEDYPQEIAFAEDELMLNLNCNGGYASATNPGASVASPEGKAAIKAEEEAAAEEEAGEEAAEEEE
jgi:ribosomal protein L12E/L44/L45/RPP1/RPP2